MFSETIELRGHIIDSLILPKVLDQILTHGANFKITGIDIGKKRADQSFARIEVSAETTEALDELILRLRQHGAEIPEKADAQLAPAPAEGVFPRDFYVTTNQQTFVRFDGKEIEVRPAMMDSAISVDRKRGAARAVKFFDVRKGDEIVQLCASCIGSRAEFLRGLILAIDPKCRIPEGLGPGRIPPRERGEEDLIAFQSKGMEAHLISAGIGLVGLNAISA